MMAKYLATSLAILNVVSAPRVIKSCLPTSTTSISLVGLESRSTMLAASLAACVPVFIATPTSAWANAGASLVPSPVIATGLLGDGSSRQGVVPGDHDRANAHLAQFVEACTHAPLDDILEFDHSQHARPLTRAIGASLGLGHHQRRAADAGNAIDDHPQFIAARSTMFCHVGYHRVRRPFADRLHRCGSISCLLTECRVPISLSGGQGLRARVHPAHTRHRRERDEGRPRSHFIRKAVAFFR